MNYPFKVNYIDIKGIEGQNAAVLRVEDATNTNVVFEVYPRGRANFVNYSNDTAFTIMQTKTNYAALRLYVPASHSSSVFDIFSSGPTTSTFINVTSGGSDVFRVTTNETSIGNNNTYSSFVVYGGNGSVYDYVRLYSDGNTSGMLEMQNLSTAYTYCRLQPVGFGNTAYYLYTKNAQTGGYIVDVGSYTTRKFTVDYAGNVYLTGSIGVNTAPSASYDIHARSANVHIRAISDTNGNSAIFELASYDNTAQQPAELRLVGRSDTFNQVGGVSSKITFNSRYNSDTGLITTAQLSSQIRTASSANAGNLQIGVFNTNGLSGLIEIYSKGSTTPGLGMGINTYPSGGADLAVAGTSWFGGLMSVDSITAYTTNANLAISGNGTGGVIAKSPFRVESANGTNWITFTGANSPSAFIIDTASDIYFRAATSDVANFNTNNATFYKPVVVNAGLGASVDTLNVNTITARTTNGNLNINGNGTGAININTTTSASTYIGSTGGGGLYVDTISSKTNNTNLILAGLGTGIVYINDSLTVANDLVVTGNLTVNGLTTTINTTTLTVDDKNIELGSVASPTDITADGGGITLLGTSNKTILWQNSDDTWHFNQNIMIESSGIAGISLYSSTTNMTYQMYASGGVVTNDITSSGATKFRYLDDVQVEANLLVDTITTNSTSINAILTLTTQGTSLNGSKVVTDRLFEAQRTVRITGGNPSDGLGAALDVVNTAPHDTNVNIRATGAGGRPVINMSSSTSQEPIIYQSKATAGATGTFSRIYASGSNNLSTIRQYSEISTIVNNNNNGTENAQINIGVISATTGNISTVLSIKNTGIEVTGQITGTEPWIVYSTDAGFTAVANKKYMMNTSANTADITVTLPSSGLVDGTTVVFCDQRGQWGTANKRVIINTTTIEGVSQNLTLNVANSTVTFVYSTDGWGWKAIIVQP